MKLFVKLLAFVLILAVAGPFFLKGPDGAPLWTVQATLDELRRWRPGPVANPLEAVVPDVAPSVQVYRWQDAAGQWHFSTEPPATGTYQVLEIDPRTNAVMTGGLPQVDEPEVLAEDDSAADPYVAPLLPIPDPEKTRELIEQVREIEALAEERLKTLETEL